MVALKQHALKECFAVFIAAGEGKRIKRLIVCRKSVR